jgi:uncharacterized protein YcbX
MITVRSLHIYPVKSCRGIDLEAAEVTATGFRFDRRWMVVTPDGGFLSQRSHPELARVSTRLEHDRLILDATDRSSLEVVLARTSHQLSTADDDAQHPAVLSHPGVLNVLQSTPPRPEMRKPGCAQRLDALVTKPGEKSGLDVATGDQRSVTIWNDTCTALSAGPEAAEWFSSLIGTACELVRQPDAGIRQVDTGYADPGDRVAFADGFPFLLISQASVDELNRRLATPVPADRFRANIIIDGCGPHAEDGWSTITVGELGFRVAKPCARCVVITTDQHDGSRSTEPLRTLAGYRTINGKVLFGQNLVHQGMGTLRVGDIVCSIPPG